MGSLTQPSGPVLRVAHPPSYAPEREYVLDVLLRQFLGLDYVAHAEQRDDVELTLHDGGAGHVRLVEGLFAVPEQHWLAPSSLPPRPLPRAESLEGALAADLPDGSLPVLFGAPLPDGRWAARADEGVSLGIDVLGGSFFMLTRYEEVAVAARDAHGRFPASASIAAQEGFLERPIVNEYLELLWAALASTWPRIRRSSRSFRVHATHDVDCPMMPVRSTPAVARSLAGDLLRRRDPMLALDRLRAEPARRRGREGADLADAFDFLMDRSEAGGGRSAFYFMAGTSRPPYDSGYSLEHPFVSGLMRRIHDRGHEIGLHPSYDSFSRPELLDGELRHLRDICGRLGIEQKRWGGRQHFLRWENPTTWQAWDDAGLDYDSTLGFADRAGFRAGVCFEYPAFNLRSRRRLRLRERPLIAMERSLFVPERASRAGVQERVADLRARCRRFGGELVLLWHNTSLLSRRDRRLYDRILSGG